MFVFEKYTLVNPLWSIQIFDTRFLANMRNRDSMRFLEHNAQLRCEARNTEAAAYHLNH